MNRRDLLKASAAVTGVVAGGAGALPAIAHPELLSALSSAEQALDRLRTARAAKKKAHVDYFAMVGEPPELARGLPEDRGLGLLEIDRDLEGRTILDGKTFRSILSPYRAAEHFAAMDKRRRRAKRLGFRLRLAIEYERRKTEAVEAIDLEAIEKAIYSAEHQAKMAVRTVIAWEAQSLADVAAKARGWAIVSEADTCGGEIGQATRVVMADVVRICGGAS